VLGRCERITPWWEEHVDTGNAPGGRRHGELEQQRADEGIPRGERSTNTGPCIRCAACDYLTKPVDPRRLRVLLEKIADRHDSLRQVTALKRQLHSDGRFGRTVGASPQIRAVYTLIEQGTLFLDEIAEMDPSIQAKLLRVLQERTVRRLGGKSELPVDVRVFSSCWPPPSRRTAGCSCLRPRRWSRR